ncbi:hypothetical protein PROFUN_05805 [Planoprotostelium fungivorum]|uniref:Uncharacterized protein n=1 Tax=Planoprotostelium fungivorum TaxID=1890364 RepID=A0A2P6NPZ8_9EUKA|nr:hypothetical protein PROFUN_05805 [Planoprotostelium fungivorum]
MSDGCDANHLSITRIFLCGMVNFFRPVIHNPPVEIESQLQTFLGTIIASLEENKNTRLGLFAVTFYLLMMQMIGSGIVTPLVFGAIGNRPGRSSIQSSLSSAIIPSICLGFLFPSALMKLDPTVIGVELQSRLIAAWQPFPVYILISFFIFYHINRLIFSRDETSSGGLIFGRGKMPTLRRLYVFAFFLTLAAHVTSMHKLIMMRGLQGLSGAFVPSVAHGYGSTVPDVITGAQVFLQWDLIWSAAAAVLLSALTLTSGIVKVSVLFFLLSLASVIIGPGEHYDIDSDKSEHRSEESSMHHMWTLHRNGSSTVGRLKRRESASLLSEASPFYKNSLFYQPIFGNRNPKITRTHHLSATMFPGPVCSICCTIFSLWGALMLGVMALLYNAGYEKMYHAAIESAKQSVPPTEFDPHFAAVSSGIAALIYAIFFVLCGARYICLRGFKKRETFSFETAELELFTMV